MYDNPIKIMTICDDIRTEMMKQTEEVVFQEIRRIGVNVDKEELVKALMHDRDQYEHGYSDGYDRAIEEFSARIHSISQKSAIRQDRYNGEPIYSHPDGTWHNLIDDAIKEMEGE